MFSWLKGRKPPPSSGGGWNVYTDVAFPSKGAFLDAYGYWPSCDERLSLPPPPPRVALPIKPAVKACGWLCTGCRASNAPDVYRCLWCRMYRLTDSAPAAQKQPSMPAAYAAKVFDYKLAMQQLNMETYEGEQTEYEQAE